MGSYPGSSYETPHQRPETAPGGGFVLFKRLFVTVTVTRMDSYCHGHEGASCGAQADQLPRWCVQVQRGEAGQASAGELVVPKPQVAGPPPRSGLQQVSLLAHRGNDLVPWGNGGTGVAEVAAGGVVGAPDAQAYRRIGERRRVRQV